MNHVHPPQSQMPVQAQHLMSVTERPAQVFVRGQGAWLWDATGTRYLDWLQGWAVNALGHCPPEVAQALKVQSGLLLTPSPALYNLPSLQLAEKLCALSGMDQVFFGSTGAEANECAIKLARKWGRLHRGGAHEIITFEHAFHGRNLSTMAASGKAGWDALFPPNMPGFVKAKLNDIDSVKAVLGEGTAAIMLEPVQGEAGVRPADAAFLKVLRLLCDAQGVLLIFDEVQTGCGRLGTLLAAHHYGVQPDIMTLGKGLGGGVPISAVLARAHACVFAHGDQGGTHAGNPLMCAVGLAMLDTLSQPAFLAHVRAMGALLRQGLLTLSQRWGLGEVRGEGLLLALELGCDRAPEVVCAGLERGLLVNAPRAHCLRLMPRLNSTEAEILEGLALLDASLAQVMTPALQGA
jgi:acetylornithine/N-succinyldiaminopimelate aminotransferase